MAGVTDAPGQGDQLAVVSIQDKETVTATANIILGDNIAALQPGESELGKARRTTVKRGTRMQNPLCVLCAICTLMFAVHH